MTTVQWFNSNCTSCLPMVLSRLPSFIYGINMFTMVQRDLFMRIYYI